MKKHDDYLESLFKKTNLNEAEDKKEDKKIEGYGEEVYEYLDKQEKFMEENDDLYKVFNSIDNVISSKNEYQKIQSVDSKVDVNNKRVLVTGITKTDDYDSDVNILELFVDDLKEYNKDIKSKFKYDYTIEEINMGDNAMHSEGKLILKLEIK